MSLSIQLQPRGRGYVQLGTQTDGGAGVVPNSIVYGGDLDEFGCLDLSFKLKLNPKWGRTIIEHFTPVVVYDGSTAVWSGRIIQAPTTFADDAEVTVQCHGWGQHLKDDCTDREWVVDDLSRFVDQRSMPTAILAVNRCFSSGQVVVNGHEIAFLTPISQALTAEGLIGVTIDLGPNNFARRVIVPFTSSANTTNQIIAVYCTTVPNIYGTAAGGSNTSPLNVSSGTLRLSPGSVNSRYVHVYVQTSIGYTPAADVWAKVSSIKIFTDTTDESADASILKASTAISETIDSVAPLISTDRSRLVATSTSIPNFPGKPGYRFGDELIKLANAIHGYKFILTPDPTPVPVFAALPTLPSFVVGAGEYQLSDPAAFDGREVYSRVISEFEDAAGVRGIAVKDTSDIASIDPGYGPQDGASIAGGNTSFTTDASGWTNVTRSTTVGEYNSAPGGGVIAGGSTGSATISGLTVGKFYRVSLRIKDGTGLIGGYAIQYTVGSQISTMVSGAGFMQHYFTFRATATSLTLSIKHPESRTLYIDDFAIRVANDNITLERGFIRTALKQVGFRTQSAQAELIAQLELNGSQYPPFKGTITVSGRVRTPGGGSISVRHLPSRVGDAILIENLKHPNTHGLGRQGIIQAATYTEATDSCEVTIDSAAEFLRGLQAFKTRVQNSYIGA